MLDFLVGSLLFFTSVENLSGTPTHEALPLTVGEKTAVVIEWDQVLFPTDYYRSHISEARNKWNTQFQSDDFGKLLSLQIKDNFRWQALDQQVNSLLESLEIHHDVWIVTAGELHWVFDSSKIFLPKSHERILNYVKNGRILTALENHNFQTSKAREILAHLKRVLGKKGKSPYHTLILIGTLEQKAPYKQLRRQLSTDFSLVSIELPSSDIDEIKMRCQLAALEQNWEALEHKLDLGTSIHYYHVVFKVMWNHDMPALTSFFGIPMGSMSPCDPHWSP